MVAKLLGFRRSNTDSLKGGRNDEKPLPHLSSKSIAHLSQGIHKRQPSLPPLIFDSSDTLVAGAVDLSSEAIQDEKEHWNSSYSPPSFSPPRSETTTTLFELENQSTSTLIAPSCRSTERKVRRKPVPYLASEDAGAKRRDGDTETIRRRSDEFDSSYSTGSSSSGSDSGGSTTPPLTPSSSTSDLGTSTPIHLYSSLDRAKALEYRRLHTLPQHPFTSPTRRRSADLPPHPAEPPTSKLPPFGHIFPSFAPNTYSSMSSLSRKSWYEVLRSRGPRKAGEEVPKRVEKRKIKRKESPRIEKEDLRDYAEWLIASQMSRGRRGENDCSCSGREGNVLTDVINEYKDDGSEDKRSIKSSSFSFKAPSILKRSRSSRSIQSMRSVQSTRGTAAKLDQDQDWGCFYDEDNVEVLVML